MTARPTLGASRCDGLRWRLNRRGSFKLSDAEHGPIGLGGRKARAIVGYLAVHADQRVARDVFIELLWPDRSRSHARGSLRQCLLEIRRAAPGLISSDGAHLWLEAKQVTLDGPQENARASELFDDLNGISPPFDDWLRCERAAEAGHEWLELERAVDDILSRADGGKALPLIERMHRIDPYNDDWVRLAMRAQCQLGHPAGIVRCFNEFVDCLNSDLGVLPATETRSLRDHLLNELTVKGPERDCWGGMNFASQIPLVRLYAFG
jgi:DNA-binding SARP family transcriptional activator